MPITFLFILSNRKAVPQTGNNSYHFGDLFVDSLKHIKLIRIRNTLSDFHQINEVLQRHALVYGIFDHVTNRGPWIGGQGREEFVQLAGLFVGFVGIGALKKGYL